MGVASVLLPVALVVFILFLEVESRDPETVVRLRREAKRSMLRPVVSNTKYKIYRRKRSVLPLRVKRGFLTASVNHGGYLGTLFGRPKSDEANPGIAPRSKPDEPQEQDNSGGGVITFGVNQLGAIIPEQTMGIANAVPLNDPGQTVLDTAAGLQNVVPAGTVVQTVESAPNALTNGVGTLNAITGLASATGGVAGTQSNDDHVASIQIRRIP